MISRALLLLPLLSSVAGQQCSTSEDCLTDDAPHCSRWGWCQWTAQYGDAGPSQWESDNAPPGSCRSAQDCTPRAPVCSNQGFCTIRPSHHQKHSAPPPSKARSQTVSSQGQRVQTIEQPRNNHQTHRTSEAARVPASSFRVSRTHQQFLKSQSNRLDSIVTNNFKRSSGRGNPNQNNNHQIKQKTTKIILESLPAVPDQTTKSSRNLPQFFEPLIAVPVPGIRRNVRTTTSTTTTSPPPDYVDRISKDYYDYYDQYDYNYYTEFEVMKMKEPTVSKSAEREQPNSSIPQRSSGSRSRGQSQPAPRLAPQASVSQGCLTDCVTDCVRIQQLTAYRDCVEFCGKTCNDKK